MFKTCYLNVKMEALILLLDWIIKVACLERLISLKDILACQISLSLLKTTLFFNKTMPSTLSIIELRSTKQILITSLNTTRMAPKLNRKSRCKSFQVTIRMTIICRVMKGCATASINQKVKVLNAWAK